MLFPEKKYQRLHDVKRQWGLKQEDLYYAIENGLLRTSIWLPMRSMEIGVIKDGNFIYEMKEHVEGFVGLRSQDCHMIFSQGQMHLRIFRSTDQEKNILRLAYEPPQPDISVRISDILILKEHKEEFETNYNVSKIKSTRAKEPVANFIASDNYKHVIMDDIEFHFGDVQAKIMEVLHDAALSRNPWVHGKTLIAATHSRASRMRDIFKKKKIWEHLLVSDKRGSYRLNFPLQYADDTDVRVIQHST